MKLSVLYFAMLCTAAAIHALNNDCGSYCECDNDSAVSCYNIPHFPRFISTFQIEMLFLNGGSLTRLGVASDNYPRLTTLILRYCDLIWCSDIEQLRSERPSLIITVVGNCTAGHVEPTSTMNWISPSIISVVAHSTRHDDIEEVTPSHPMTSVTRAVTISRQTPVADSSKLQATSQSKDTQLTTILATSLTSVIAIVGGVLCVVGFCVYKKCRDRANRVRTFQMPGSDTDDDIELPQVEQGIVNHGYGQTRV